MHFTVILLVGSVTFNVMKVVVLKPVVLLPLTILYSSIRMPGYLIERLQTGFAKVASHERLVTNDFVDVSAYEGTCLTIICSGGTAVKQK